MEVALHFKTVILHNMKTIFETFKKSIYNPAFYRTAKDTPFWEIFRFYSKITFVLTLLMTIVLGVLLVPRGITFVKNRAPELVRNYYPKELVVHIEKGEASANVPMPYIVPVKQLTGVAPLPDALQNMLVIDTTHDFEKNTFVGYKTYALLTKTELVTQSDVGQITIQDLRGAPTMTVSQEVLLNFVGKIQNSLLAMVIGGVFATFTILALGYLIYLIPLLLFALIPFSIAWVKKSPLSYGEAYKVSLYAIIPALALKTAINLMGIFFLPPYFTLLVFMLIIAINMREGEQPKLFEN